MAIDKPDRAARILLVDDDISMRFLAGEALVGAGFCVTEAENGAEALLEIAQSAPDLVLMDVMMPIMDGFTACEKIRQMDAGKYLPILLMTSLDDTESIDKGYAVGATNFVIKPANYFVLIQNIRYILRATEQTANLVVSQRRLENTQRIARLGLIELDLESKELHVSDKALDLLGLRSDQVGEDYLSLFINIHHEDMNLLDRKYEHILRGNDKFSVVYRVMDNAENKQKSANENSMRTIQHEAQVIEELNSPRLLVSSLQDITERQEAENKISKLLYYDTLTKLPNFTFFFEHLEFLIEHSKVNNYLFAILSIDIDNFALINDSFGIAAGDELLKDVSLRLTNMLRKSDNVSFPHGADSASNTLVRASGNEFLLSLCYLHHNDEVARVAERVMGLFEKPFMCKENSVNLSVSIGISVYPTDGERIDDLLSNAGSSLRNAKNSGKNNYKFYSSEFNDNAIKRVSLETALRNAIDNNEFVLYYQPKVDIHENLIKGVEALIRWHHPERGLLSPAEFIPTIENSELVFPVGEWVINEACRQTKSWQEAGLAPMTTAVNISARQFEKGDLAEIVSKALKKYNLEGRYLELEVTEGVLIGNFQKSNSTLNELRQLGVQIALDDFGTGYSSLSYLRQLPIDTLKIDRSFIQDISEDDNCLVIVSSIISLAKGLKLRTVAEGIETQEQLHLLSQCDVDDIQGYYYFRPSSSEDFVSWLTSGEWKSKYELMKSKYWKDSPGLH